MYYYVNSNELYHHGVLGMKWGIRRYQPYRNGKKGKEVGEAAKVSVRERVKNTVTSDKFKKGVKTALKVGAGAAAIGTSLVLGSQYLNKIFDTPIYGLPIKEAAKQLNYRITTPVTDIGAPPVSTRGSVPYDLGKYLEEVGRTATLYDAKSSDIYVNWSRKSNFVTTGRRR